MIPRTTLPAAASIACLSIILMSGCGGVSFNMPGPMQEGADGEVVPRNRAPRAGRSGNKKKFGNKKSKEEAVIASALAKAGQNKTTYRINSADLLIVTVFQENNMERKARVSPSGTITIPLIGKVQVGGLEVAEAENLIETRLKKFIVSPQVSIFISEYGNKLVYVLGEVKNPGSYKLPTESSLTVLEAVTLAGGFTEYAAHDRTRIIRKSDGQNQNIQIEISAITEKGDKSKDIMLHPNDVVFVPESFF